MLFLVTDIPGSALSRCIISPWPAPSLTTLVTERESQSPRIAGIISLLSGRSGVTTHIITTFFVTNSWCQMPAVPIQCSLVTRDGGRARAGDTSHIVTAAQSTSGYNWPGTTTWRKVNCDTQHERASWGNQYITPWKVRIEHGQSLDNITTYKIRIRNSTVRLSKSNLILDICRDRREQEQRERDRLDKERAEREKRDREERDRRERERVERERAKMREIEVQKERERQAVQAMEDVNRHFELSMELAKKVSCPVQIVNDGDGSLNDS